MTETIRHLLCTARRGVCSFLLLAVVTGLTLTACAANEAELRRIAAAYEAAEARARVYAGITYWGASAPIGHFLLVRKDTAVCALRFTEFHRGEARQPTIFYGGDPSLSATYDWFYQGDGSGDFSKPTVKVGQGEASQKAPVGLFRVRFPRGDPYVGCGSLVLLWIYPNNVGFFPKRYGEDIELAPTKWKDLAEANPHDPRLTWYRYDETRKDIRIPIDTLW